MRERQNGTEKTLHELDVRGGIKKNLMMAYNILYKKKDVHKMKGIQTCTYIHATAVKLGKHLFYQPQIIVGDRTSCFLFEESKHRSGGISVFASCSTFALPKRKE